MKIRQGFKFRLEPTPEQRQLFARFAGSCRFVYNKLLSLNNERYQDARFVLNAPKIPEYVGHGLLKLWKQSDEYGWLRETYSQCLQQAVKDLERAYTNLFDGRADAPTKRKKFKNDSCRFPQGFDVKDNQVKFPKIGWVRFTKSREILGTIKNVTVSRKGHHWFVSFQTEREVEQPAHPSASAVGIDLGIASFAMLSNGTVYQPLNGFRRLEAKLAKFQRQLALKEKFSNNWKRVKRKILRLHTRIADARADYLHKVSTEISQNHAIIVVEALKISNMSKSAKGTVENPGRRVPQKSGLNQSILHQGWGMFRQMLEYKQLWRGGQVIAVAPQYTSQRCRLCGHTDPANRTTQAEFQCCACGHREHADLNASHNILAAGQVERLNACGI